MTEKTQKIRHMTLAGPKPLTAPGGWKFAKTDTIVWAKLCERTSILLDGKFKTQRDRHKNDAEIEVLSIVLANALGMASFYWRQAAIEIVKKEGNR